MSYVVSQISVTDGTNPKWIVKWPAESTAPSTPPTAAQAVLSDTGFPYWYLSIGTGGQGTDPSEEFWNCFYNRVSEWEVYADGIVPNVPDILITPGNTVGLPEPVRVDVLGSGDWDVLSSLVTVVGGRGGYVKREQFLPAEDPTVASEDTESFQYKFETTLRNTTDASVTISLVYEFAILGHIYLLYGGIAYFPIIHRYTWHWIDDGGESDGGFVSKWSEIPLDGVVQESGISTLIRLGKTTFIDDQHPEEHMAFGFPAFEVRCPQADGLGGLTTTETVDTIQLEVDGDLTPGDVWIQPSHIVDEKYFGFRFYNDDDTTALFDPESGHRTTADPLPMSMTDQLEPQ